MKSCLQLINFIFIIALLMKECETGNRFWMTTDERWESKEKESESETRTSTSIKMVLNLNPGSALDSVLIRLSQMENHISPQDLEEFLKFYDQNGSSTTVDTRRRNTESADYASVEETVTSLPVPDEVDCFGLGSVTNQLRWILNLSPDSSEKVNVHYYFSSRKQQTRVQVMAGQQFGLEWVDFSPLSRRTVVIVHGFMSHSNASWVNDLTRAFLLWVIDSMILY
ncbi:hypothetical protein EVAR_79337_1 [Eumeta japonica]|uniref:Lipase domain-containing protein n=1 Tax=Eumeta variegata TaxID=151549 RepID=A0A4C1TEN6_EUMVA|nr:hypothetical protein EVAR_79337_1 [Eumeta japonica]